MLHAAECCYPRSGLLLLPTTPAEFCIRTPLPCIDTPSILLPFGSSLYHLGKLGRIDIALEKFDVEH